MFSSDVVAFLARSSMLVPPLLWHAEDYNIGRLTVPFAQPVENPRFHDFFNATINVRKAFKRSVPLILDYCYPQDYIIHKNPWGSYRYIGNDHTMYCTASDFADAKKLNSALEVHECNARVFGTNWTLPTRSSSLNAYYEPYISIRKAKAGRVNDPKVAAGLKYQMGGTGLESCTSHFFNVVAAASTREKVVRIGRDQLLRDKAKFDSHADGGMPVLPYDIEEEALAPGDDAQT